MRKIILLFIFTLPFILYYIIIMLVIIYSLSLICLIENSRDLNNSAIPVSCFKRRISSISIPICLEIQTADFPEVINSRTISDISDIIK